MLKRILPLLGLGKSVPEDWVKKGLEKVSPRLKTFFDQASKHGHSLGAAIGFLQSELGGRRHEVDQNLRPDEAANIELKRQEDLPMRLAKTASSVATGAALGGLGGAALSGLSAALPTSPEPAQIAQQPSPQPQGPQGGGQAQGYNPLTGVLQKYPDLGRFLDQQINSGTDPIVAAGQAKSMKKFKNDIFNIEQEIGSSFESLLGQLFNTKAQEKTSFGNAQAELARLIQEYISKKRGK